jgi:hypothetical protein
LISIPSPLGREGTARRGVRGFFRGNVLTPLEVGGSYDFDGTLKLFANALDKGVSGEQNRPGSSLSNNIMIDERRFWRRGILRK